MKKAILFTAVIFLLLMTLASNAQETTQKQKSEIKMEKIQKSPASQVEKKGVATPDHTHAKVSGTSIDVPDYWRNPNSNTRIKTIPAHVYFNNAPYQIKLNKSGFELYEKGSSNVYAKLVPTPKEGLYRYTSSTKNGAAHFDKKGNLILKYLDNDTGKTKEIKFQSN